MCVCLCVGIGACMLVCMWYTELTNVYRIGPLEQSSTDIVGQVLGHSVCGCVCVWRDFLNDSLPSQVLLLCTDML